MKKIISMAFIYLICFSAIAFFLGMSTFLLTPLVNLIASSIFGVTITDITVCLALVGTIIAGYIRSFIMLVDDIKRDAEKEKEKQ